MVNVKTKASISEVINEEEKVLLEQHREKTKNLEACNNELKAVLTKYKATLVIDPGSPLADIRIMVKLI